MWNTEFKTKTIFWGKQCNVRESFYYLPHNVIDRFWA